jgi:hypothetical protein
MHNKDASKQPQSNQTTMNESTKQKPEIMKTFVITGNNLRTLKDNNRVAVPGNNLF